MLALSRSGGRHNLRDKIKQQYPRVEQYTRVSATMYGSAHRTRFNLKCSLNAVGVHNDLLVGADNRICIEAAKLDGTACVVGRGLFFNQTLDVEANDQGSEEYAQVLGQLSIP